MTPALLLRASERWFRLLLGLYPEDFRDQMGEGLVETYRRRAADALGRGGLPRLAGVWLGAFADSLRSGLGERLRPAVSWRRAGSWGKDLGRVRRRLTREPALVVAMVGTLTVGLGAFAVVYAVVQRTLLDPLPFPDSRDLYVVFRDYRPRFDLSRGSLAGTDVVELQASGGVVAGAAAMRRELRTLSVPGGQAPMEAALMYSTANLFDVLRAAPELGRLFAPSEGGRGREPVLVLSYDLWNRLGTSPSLVGADVRINGRQHRVIGVLPRSFEFPTRGLGRAEAADAYATFDVDLATTNPDAGMYHTIIRARAGTSPETLASAVGAIGEAIDRRYFNGAGIALRAVGLKDDLLADVRPVLLVLALAGALLLLVLTVNVASVLLARTAQRGQEFAVTRALGANGVAVVRATIVEGGVLGLIGGIVAAATAFWTLDAAMALAPLDLPRRQAITMDWQIAAVVIGVGTLLGLAAALAPASWAARVSLSSLLAASAVRGGGGGHGRLRRGMVVAQVALSLILLSAGGLVARSLERLLSADPGFTPAGVLTMRVPVSTEEYPSMDEALALQDRIEQALGALRGVSAASAASALPLTAGASQTTVGIAGAPGNTGDLDKDHPLVDHIAARAGYVELMGIRMVAGRTFNRFRSASVQEALIDRALADRFFPGGSPLGSTLTLGGQPRTIVGVFEQARLYDVHQDGWPQVLIRAEDRYDDVESRNLSFVLRASRDPLELVAPALRAIREIDPRLAVADVKTMEEIVRDATRPQQTSAVLITGFALAALLLAAVGIYGVTSNSVMRRRHELAVRLAFGADDRGVVGLVLREGAVLVAVGLLVGVPGVYAASWLLRGMLIDVSPFDPLTLVLVSAGLTGVALAACYVPARRAAMADPATLLRQG